MGAYMWAYTSRKGVHKCKNVCPGRGRGVVRNFERFGKGNLGAYMQRDAHGWGRREW
jgi:hypothetical protein